jgi:hypothetical protein
MWEIVGNFNFYYFGLLYKTIFKSFFLLTKLLNTFNNSLNYVKLFITNISFQMLFL